MAQPSLANWTVPQSYVDRVTAQAMTNPRLQAQLVANQGAYDPARVVAQQHLDGAKQVGVPMANPVNMAVMNGIERAGMAIRPIYESLAGAPAAMSEAARQGARGFQRFAGGPATKYKNPY